MNYQGNQGGKSVPKAWLKVVLDAVADAIKNSDVDLFLMPFDDEKFKKKKLWIRTEPELRSKVKTFRDLQNYLDMDYGNAQYPASNNKPGDKQFRTRMRWGFRSGTDPEAVMRYLHDGLRTIGNRAGCFSSPVQFGRQVKIGFLCFYPGEMSKKAVLKELMRHFGFKIPMGLHWDWVNLPYRWEI